MEPWMARCLAPEYGVVFVDTSRKCPEDTIGQTNMSECLIIESVLKNFIQLGVKTDDICVLSPYK